MAHVYVMLTIFFGVFLVLLVIQLFRSPGGEAPGGGSKAYSPSDFEEIFNNPVLEGLKDLSVEKRGEEKGFEVPPPPFSKDIFPCSDCHEGDPGSAKPRKLDEPHDVITLEHGEKANWCFTCHDQDNRDMLKLADGRELPFTESYLLCGQCHGTILRDWKAGVHGKRMGYWNGHKRYLLCAHCHNPHKPRFSPLKPLPPPVPQGGLAKWDEGAKR